MKVSTLGGKTGQGSFIVDRRGTILGFDDQMEGLTGWPAIDVVGRHKDLTQPLGKSNGSPAVSNGSSSLYDGQIPEIRESRSLHLTLNARDGRRLEVEAVADRIQGPGDRLLVSILRILAISATRSQRGAAESRDHLCLLGNAESFWASLGQEFDDSTKTARPLSLVLADVDRLRRINDRFGADAGDRVLQRLAGLLRVSVEDESRLFRLADDDFAILMPGAGRGDARQLAAHIRSTVERYDFFDAGDEAAGERITLSLGAASYPADADSAHEFVERAREALDEARSMGRNRVWCYLRRPRVPIHVPVYFDGAELPLVGYTRDLSPSGIFVQTSEPIDIGMRCALAFPLPGHDGKVHVIGRVVRTVPPELSPHTETIRIPGMGVEFERFGGATDRRAIDAFLHRREATTLRPETGPLSC